MNELDEIYPMTIRVRWEFGQWWAYFNGFHTAYFHARDLDSMCDALYRVWPRGTKVRALYGDGRGRYSNGKALS